MGTKFNGAALALAMLAGCGTLIPPPAEGARRAYRLRLEPHLAAVCIARNVDGYRSPYSAQIVPGVAPALVEVRVRGARLVSIAALAAASEGSIASIWMSPEPVYEADALIAAMVEGC